MNTKREELAELMTGEKRKSSYAQTPEYQIGLNLITSAMVMLDRGQSCCAYDIIRAGFAFFQRIELLPDSCTERGVFWYLR